MPAARATSSIGRREPRGPSPHSVTSLPGAACGTGKPGVCSAGTKHCLAGGLVCTSNVQASPETCDGLDNDCNGTVDDDAPGAPVWHHDVDGDGFGSATDTHASCAQPAGYVADGSDCNDGDGDIHPGAAELCNGVDDNCSGAADEGNPGSGMACATGQVGACAAGFGRLRSRGGLLASPPAFASSHSQQTRIDGSFTRGKTVRSVDAVQKVGDQKHVLQPVSLERLQ